MLKRVHWLTISCVLVLFSARSSQALEPPHPTPFAADVAEVTVTAGQLWVSLKNGRVTAVVNAQLLHRSSKDQRKAIDHGLCRHAQLKFDTRRYDTVKQAKAALADIKQRSFLVSLGALPQLGWNHGQKMRGYVAQFRKNRNPKLQVKLASWVRASKLRGVVIMCPRNTVGAAPKRGEKLGLIKLGQPLRVKVLRMAYHTGYRRPVRESYFVLDVSLPK